MNDLPSFLAILPGAMAGAACGLFLNHWLRLVLESFGKYPKTLPTTQPRSRRWPTVFSILHPVPWLLIVGIAVGTHKLLHEHAAAGWLWFWCSAFATVVGIWGVSIHAMLRIQRRRRAEA